VKIVRAYQSFVPPLAVEPIVERLLCGIPPGYLTGLHQVVLRESAGLGRRERRRKTRSRGRQVAIPECDGLYYQEEPGRPARIELFVDNVLDRSPRWLMRIPFLQDMVLARPLFHELGHHIDRRIAPRHGDIERTAEEWRLQLSRLYVRKRYWYLRPVAWPLARLFRLAAAILRRVAQALRDRRSQPG
jgi:hypothetical protein